MVNKKSRKNQNQVNANTNLNRNGNNARKNVNNAKRSKSRRSVQKRQQRKSVQKQQPKRKVVQKNKQVRRRRSLNRTNQRNNQRKRSRKNSNKRQRRQRGGYSGLDYSVLPGGVDAETGVWTANFESDADFGVLGSSYKGHMLKGAEVGVRSQFEGTILSDDKSVFEQVDAEKGKMSEKEAKEAVKEVKEDRKELRRTDAVLKELGDLSAVERKYHAAYDEYDKAPTDATTGEKVVSEDDLDILKEHGADNVARADKYRELHNEYKDDDSDIGKEIHKQAKNLSDTFGKRGLVPARNYPPK